MSFRKTVDTGCKTMITWLIMNCSEWEKGLHSSESVEEKT